MECKNFQVFLICSDWRNVRCQSERKSRSAGGSQAKWRERNLRYDEGSQRKEICKCCYVMNIFPAKYWALCLQEPSSTLFSQYSLKKLCHSVVFYWPDRYPLVPAGQLESEILYLWCWENSLSWGFNVVFISICK